MLVHLLMDKEKIKYLNFFYLMYKNDIENLYPDLFTLSTTMNDGKLNEYPGLKTIQHAIITQANLAKVYDYYKNILGRNSYDNKGSQLLAYVDVREDAFKTSNYWLNAAWVGGEEPVIINKFAIGNYGDITLAQAYDVHMLYQVVLLIFQQMEKQDR